ncbi:MAG: ATP-binding protein [bacterium]
MKVLSIYLFIIGITILIAQGLHINAGREIIREVNRNQLMIINEISSDLESLIRESQEKLITFARLYPISQLEATEILSDLRIYYELLHDRILYIGILNREGKYEYLYPRIPQWEKLQKEDFSKMDFFQNALKQADNNRQQIPYISNNYNIDFNIKGIPISLPLYTHQAGKENTIQGREFWGVLVFFLDLVIINDLCQNHYSHLHDYSSFWLIDDQGNFLSHKNESWIGQNLFHLYKEKSDEREPDELDWVIREKMLKGGTGTGTEIFKKCIYNLQGVPEKCYLNYAPVRLLGRYWSIAVTTPAIKMNHWEKRVLKSAWQWLLFIISFLLVALSFAQVLIILMHRKRIDWEKEQREKFQRAFEGITDLVYMIDIKYNLRIVNKAFINICNKHEKEIEGKKCYHLIQGRESPCLDCPIPKMQLTHTTQRVEKVIFQESVTLYTYPLINEEGRTTAIVAFARIMTKEKMLEQELQHRERLSLIGRLAACVAHEIKNPLVGIGILAQLIYDSLPSAHASMKDLERILKECQRLEHLINNFSRFSRSTPLTFDKADIHESLDISLILLRERLKKNNIQLKTSYQRDIPLIAHDVQKMQQVFLNLILNSVNAMPHGGTLNIKTYLPRSCADESSLMSFNHNVHIDIQDTGIGIPPHEQENIFKPFFSSSTNGTGLGLSIVHGIIQQHGGQIYLKSHPGRITTFTICLPVEQKNSPHPPSIF